ncbi:2-amino-4-hydroxy-6-hydroxymethyldihydropteridine diphosphokinase [Pasteurella testudinis]|uniref:2-amino-4-hydroxy-6- hydroxymethyldihydropteridine diphosphokinase n=1 Tax=Pasteurella testudinis TaxID=761 RepID=UPI004059EA2D
MTKQRCYIALGSNLAEPLEQLKQALQALNTLPDTHLAAVSSFYCSKPLGPQDQPDFINAVAAVETALLPLELLDQLQNIERQQGRVRQRRWGERTLDLDILLYGDNIINSEHLTVPHYDMHNREFVIVPLYEIAADLILPNGETLAQYHAQFVPHGMIKLDGK